MTSPAAEKATDSKRAASAEWRKCPACGAYIYHRRLKRQLGVCPECNHHLRLRLRERLDQLLDEDSFRELGAELEPVDVLSFVDTKPYTERIAAAQRKTGARSGAVYGRATIAGLPLAIAGIDFEFIGGSMGGAVGEAITLAAELALQERLPLLVISASGGARMQEGAVSLMQMVKTSQAIARLNEEGLLYISLLTDPTYGGVTASYATLGDILVAEPGAHIGFAGPKVIEQTIRQTLPDGFQTAEFLLDHGMLDLVEARESLRPVLRRILGFHASADRTEDAGAGAGGGLAVEGQPAVSNADALTRRDAWTVAQLARNQERPHTLEYAGLMFDEFQELHGDRLFGDDPAIVGGPARLGATTVMLIGHQKGRTTSEMVKRNFGMPGPEGYRKALRLMRYAVKFRLPIVTFVDTPGAYPGVGAEERGQSIAIAESIMEMSRMPVPIVTTVTGEGGSGGALGLATADRVLMLENSYYSVISPEGCSTILFKDAMAAPRAAAALRMTAPDLLRLGVVDRVIREPERGAHTDPVRTAANVRSAIVEQLAGLVELDPQQLLRERYERFRAFGRPGRQPVLPPIDGDHDRPGDQQSADG